MTLSVPQPAQPVNTVEPESIPVDLRRRPQWVVWMTEIRDGNPTKVPYNAITGDYAKTNDPATWSTFDDAWRQYERGADGIGFVFSDSDPYVGVDLDNSIDDAGRIKPWARSILRRLHSYAELSPSGQGLHIILRGQLPGGGRKRPYHDGKIEIYDRGRFFTMTGRVLTDFSLEPGLRANEPQALYRELWPEKPALTLAQPNGASPATDDDNELLTRAMAARNGVDFDRLWRGDFSGYSSQSEADLALCAHLAWWCRGDAARVDRLFRQSGLMRPKWDKRAFADGRTYGQATVERAVQSAPTSYQYPQQPEVITINPGVPSSTHSRGTDECPPLPDKALTVYEHLAPCAQWLDDYIAFASHAASRTPPSFHQSAGLFIGAVVIARRLVLRVSTKSIYPNLFLLFLARSTEHAKSTGFQIARDLLTAASLNHLLLPQRMTPESMLQELSLAVPANMSAGDQESRADWLRERPFAARRGWALDEAQKLFDSLSRDFNAGLLPMLLDFYECPESTTEQTVGRWRTKVHRAYLSFFGGSTPAAMAPHLTNRSLWHNGLWARFALVTPDTPPVWAWWTQAMEISAPLVAGIQRLDNLFPPLSARLVDVETEDGTRRKAIEIEGDDHPVPVVLAPGVESAWETYAHAMFDLMVQSRTDDLNASYGRLDTLAIKVAMILAAFDTATLPVRVELRHFARAQQIVENWRASVHRLRASTALHEEEGLADRILAMLANAPGGLPTRDVYRPLNITARDARNLLEELERQGHVRRVLTRAANGHQVESWHHTTQSNVSVSK